MIQPAVIIASPFRPLASLGDLKELHHDKLLSTSAGFDTVCDLINFIFEAKNSSFQIHGLNLEGLGGLDPFNYLVSHQEIFSRFVEILVHIHAHSKTGPQDLCQTRKNPWKRNRGSFFN